MINTHIKMVNKDNWSRILVCITDERSITHIHHLNSQQLLAILTDLILADASEKNAITLVINESHHEYGYPVWQGLYGAISEWIDDYLTRNPDFQLYEI